MTSPSPHIFIDLAPDILILLLQMLSLWLHGCTTCSQALILLAHHTCTCGCISHAPPLPLDLRYNRYLPLGLDDPYLLHLLHLHVVPDLLLLITLDKLQLLHMLAIYLIKFLLHFGIFKFRHLRYHFDVRKALIVLF